LTFLLVVQVCDYFHLDFQVDSHVGHCCVGQVDFLLEFCLFFSQIPSQNRQLTEHISDHEGTQEISPPVEVYLADATRL
jgi:hypothetical protein